MAAIATLTQRLEQVEDELRYAFGPVTDADGFTFGFDRSAMNRHGWWWACSCHTLRQGGYQDLEIVRAAAYGDHDARVALGS
jgi:hypothetical protein